MRGPKDEGKAIRPMFPRLHVNDTKKGGPRAPPRNKMALYEQLSIPSQGYAFGSASVLAMSSSQGDGFERGAFTPFCNSPPSLHSEKPFSHSYGGVKLSTKMASQERKSMNSTKFTFQDPMERSALVPTIQDKTSAGASSNPSSKAKSTESLKQAHPLSNQERRSSSGDVLKGLHGANAQSNQNFVAMQDKTVHNFLVKSAGGIGKIIVSKARHESCSRLSVGDDNRSHNENGSRNHKDKQHGSLQVGDIERRDDVSESSMVDSISALELTSHDVVRVIGKKKFWKARRAIVNQQRVFTEQVFELHRLIKVQKSIAGSPKLLLEDHNYVGKASMKVSPLRKVASENAIERPPLTDKPKDTFQKPYSNAEFTDENAVGKLPLPSINNETSKGLLNQQSNYPSHSDGILPSPITTNTRSSRWCFPPAVNQWSVPVMSPSEGLVYELYTGPCPTTAGFTAPIYGNCGPMSLAAGSGDFLNAAYGVPASRRQGIGNLPKNPPLGRTYFPLYAVPVMIPSILISAVEQVSPFIGPHLKYNHLSIGDTMFTFPHHSYCNMLSQMSRVISCSVGKFQASMESEVLGSTASNPSERLKGPLFPTEPTTQASNQNIQPNKPRTHVIRVVPHNPRSATESAAWILQSIQEERKQYDQFMGIASSETY